MRAPERAGTNDDPWSGRGRNWRRAGCDAGRWRFFCGLEQAGLLNWLPAVGASRPVTARRRYTRRGPWREPDAGGEPERAAERRVPPQARRVRAGAERSGRRATGTTRSRWSSPTGRGWWACRGNEATIRGFSAVSADAGGTRRPRVEDELYMANPAECCGEPRGRCG